jgi:hypothetical protein
MPIDSDGDDIGGWRIRSGSGSFWFGKLGV